MQPLQRKPSQRILRQVVRLDRGFMPETELTIKKLQSRKLFWIENNKTVVAYAVIGTYAGTYRLETVAVVQEWRRNKLAHRLIKSAIKWVKKQGATALHTYAAFWNIPSMNMLIGLGFRISSVRYAETQHWIHFKRNI